jgi:hypothetical protein
MKKVLSFVGAALFVAAMTVSCGNNNTEATDTIDSTAVEVVDEPAAAVEEVSAPVDNNARDLAIAEAAEKICNCASGDKTKLQECLKSIISTGYAAYKDDKSFTDAVYEKALKCAAEKAATTAVDKVTDKAAEELSKKLKF